MGFPWVEEQEEFLEGDGDGDRDMGELEARERKL